jgi:hypothetical protein
MKPLTRARATACENAKGGRCRCRCRGALHGAGRTSDTAALPLEDPHRSELTDSERRELAARWAAEACACVDTGPPPALSTGEQLRLFRLAEPLEAPAAPGPGSPAARSDTRVGDRAISALRGVDGRAGASKQIHA